MLFALVGALELVHDQANPFTGTLDYLIEGVFVAALVAGAAALWQLRDAGARIPFTIAAAGHAVLVLPAAATFARGSESLDPLFPLGVLAILGGIIAAAVLDVRGRVAPRRAGLAPARGLGGHRRRATPRSAIAAGWALVALRGTAAAW